MGFSSEYLYCFHYPDSLGYLIFCCHCVDNNRGCISFGNLIKAKSAFCHFIFVSIAKRTPDIGIADGIAHTIPKGNLHPYTYARVNAKPYAKPDSNFCTAGNTCNRRKRIHIATF